MVHLARMQRDVDLTASSVRPLLLALGLGAVAAAGTLAGSDVAGADRAIVVRHAAVGAILALVVAAVSVRSWHDHDLVRRAGVPTVIALAVTIGAAGGAAASSRPVDGIRTPTADEEIVVRAPNSASGTAAVPPPTSDERVPAVDITDAEGIVVLVVGLGLLVAAASFLLRRSELRAVARSGVYLGSDLVLDEPRDIDDPPDDRRLAEALRNAARRLDAADDHRSAIRAAYGELLVELERAHMGRHRYEGPLEHVHRVLGHPCLPAAGVTELVDLFALARFSTHDITADHVARARALLETCTEQLDSMVGA